MSGLTDTGRTCMFNPANRISRNDHTLKVQVPFAKKKPIILRIPFILVLQTIGAPSLAMLQTELP